MRRRDRELQRREEILEVMARCDVCRLAMQDGDYPYIVPLNFGLQVRDDQIFLVFHGAKEGKKLTLLAKDNRVGFEMDCGHRLVLDAAQGNCTMTYESVVGRGHIEMVPEEEKTAALQVLMAHYGREDFAFNPAVVPHTAVYRLVVEACTGKARRKG